MLQKSGLDLTDTVAGSAITSMGERLNPPSTALMPTSRRVRRGQAPQPRSGAPKAQGLTMTHTPGTQSSSRLIAISSNTVRRVEYRFLHGSPHAIRSRRPLLDPDALLTDLGL